MGKKKKKTYLFPGTFVGSLFYDFRLGLGGLWFREAIVVQLFLKSLSASLSGRGGRRRGGGGGSIRNIAIIISADSLVCA